MSSQARLDCNIVDGHYCYLSDLLALARWWGARTWQLGRRFAEYVLDGFRHGFRIGFEYSIVDLSSPREASVNDGIDCHAAVFSIVHSYRRRCPAYSAAGSRDRFGEVELAKHLSHSSRACRRSPSWCALGRRWVSERGLTVRPSFGAEDFSAIAGALRWSMYDAGLLPGIHYLDDLRLAPQVPGVCRQLVAHAGHVQSAGRSSSTAQSRRPRMDNHFLGIEINTVLGLLRLPWTSCSAFAECYLSGFQTRVHEKRITGGDWYTATRRNSDKARRIFCGV